MSDAALAAPSAVDALNLRFFNLFPKHAARKIETMPARDGAALFEAYPRETLQRVWESLAPGVIDKIMVSMSAERVAGFLDAMEAGRCAALLGRFDSKVREQFLSGLPEARAAELQELMQYPEDTAGYLMDTRVVAFNRNATVDDVLAQLKNQKVSALHDLFLLDDDQHLCGQLDIQRVALAEGSQTLASISIPVKAYVSPMDPKEDVVAALDKYRIVVLPVVDLDMRLVGTIHENAIIDAVKEDIATDMQTMVGVSKDERALSSSIFAVRKRLPWLQINLLTAFLAAAVVGIFEDTIAQYTALAILLPIAAGQSGNTGAQALAVTMRGLTLREITVRHWGRVMRKEAGAGLINGIAIAITCGLGVYVWSQSTGLALIIALAMISSMVIAGVSGALVPIVLKKLGQDPAQSSSIILTTVTDIAGFMSFLGIATLLSGMLAAG